MNLCRQEYEIDRLSLSNRTRNALRAANVVRIEELSSMTRNQVAKIYGLGDKGVIEIMQVLVSHGLSLKGAPPEWMPIHSAPKDGSWILIYSCFCAKKPDFAVARWDERYWLVTSDYGIKCIFENPTHWMPLPDRPEAGQ